MEKKLGRYDAIFGIDLMQRLGMDCCFSDLSIKWDGQEMPMHPKGFWNNPKLHSYRSYHRESAHVQALIDEGDIIDDLHVLDDLHTTPSIKPANYQAHDVHKYVASLDHLDTEQKRDLLECLLPHQELFQGILGCWPDLEIDLELTDDAKPYHAAPFRIPHSQLKLVRDEVDRQCRLGILAPAPPDTEWAAPCFVIPKHDGTVRFLTDFRRLNRCLNKRFPWPLPNITKLPAVKLKFITTNARIAVELHGTTNQVNKFYFTLVAMKLRRPSFNYTKALLMS